LALTVRFSDPSRAGAGSLTFAYSPVPQHQPDQELVCRFEEGMEWKGQLFMRVLSFQNYTDYFKCITAKGEDFTPCKQFKKAYNSLCPSASCFP
jgi:hypothetical protein